MITSEEILNIQEQFNKVLAYSQNENNPKTDKLFEIWYKAKEDFIAKFRGLIYEVPGLVSFHLGEKERVARIYNFIETITNVYQNRELAAFLTAQLTGFYENKTVVDYLTPDGTTVIKEGTKIIKAFKYFESSEELLATLQNQASMMIQEDKVEGTLCFSVHPLDYLSSSENNYNWRSCHALDGDYRSGNLSYMCDKVTIICYLRGAGLEKLPRFPETVPWNSKKWRMLITLSEHGEIMFAGRQYPFFSETALDIITPHLRRALRQEPMFWSNWHDDYINSWKYKNEKDNNNLGMFKYFPIGGKFFQADELIVDGVAPHGEPLHFNDLLRSSCYTPFYSWNYMCFRGETSDKYTFQVGSSVPCIKCEQNPIASGEHFYCCDCYNGDNSDDQTFVCDECGGRFPNSQIFVTADGSWICSQCAENKTVICERCGARIFRDEAKYNRATDNFICSNCWDDMNL